MSNNINNATLRTREWLGLMLISWLILAFAGYAGYVNSPNGSALNYVSFAGTILSIVLAILAIGYTLFDSLSQKAQSDTLVNQLTSLNKVIQNIETQSASLNRLDDLSNKLELFSESISDKITTENKKVNEKLTEIGSFMTHQKHPEENEDTQEIDPRLYMKTLLSGGYYSIETNLMLITHYSGCPLNTILTQSEYDKWFKYFERYAEEDVALYSLHYLVGGYLSTIQNLVSFGLISLGENEELYLSEALSEAVSSIDTVKPDDTGVSDILNYLINKHNKK